MISDMQMRRRLRPVKQVTTPIRKVVNEIIRVKSDTVVVRSRRTANDREISFQALRKAASTTKHGVIVRTLARVLGLC
jgi:hypothetical protein